MESETQNVYNPDISPPSPEGASSHRSNVQRGGERWAVTKEEAQEDDGHPGGGWQTETREATKEGGAREETGGTQSRRRTAGPRPQPWWWPTVEPTEGGAIQERWPPTPEGRPMATEQVVEVEMETQRVRGMQRIRGGQDGAVGSGNRGGGGSPEIRSRAGATEDPGGADGRKEPNGVTRRSQRRGVQRRWWVDARPKRSLRDEGARWSDGWCGGEGAISRGGTAWSTGWGGVRAEEAGGEGYSSPGDAGGWQTHGATFSTSWHWMTLPGSGHWRIWSPLRAGQGNHRWRRAVRNQQGWQREERGLFDFQSSIPVYQILLRV